MTMTMIMTMRRRGWMKRRKIMLHGVLIWVDLIFMQTKALCNRNSCFGKVFLFFSFLFFAKHMLCTQWLKNRWQKDPFYCLPGRKHDQQCRQAKSPFVFIAVKITVFILRVVENAQAKQRERKQKRENKMKRDSCLVVIKTEISKKNAYTSLGH